MLGLGLSIPQLAVRGLRISDLAAAIRALFAAGEQGVWYDPSDLTTLFQDAAGTTPVTAVEQPVGRILDKSGQGNHATQTTSTSRPVLSARVNLLTATETLATQTVATRATAQTLRFEGAGTVTLSGTATGTYSAGSHSVTTTEGNLTLTVSGTVTKADLRAANDGVGLPAYQRVNTSTDYDTAGFPHYLRFDGVDDWLVTPTITPGIDKAQVFAGVRKLSDADRIVSEFSVDANTNAGSFFFASQPLGRFASLSRGSSVAALSQEASVSGYLAPSTVVLSALHDIPGDLSVMRANGIAGTSAPGDKGTGNYGNYPLYIGSRGGTTLPFNGHLYSLIVRFGANLPTQAITDTETWLNGKTRAYA